MYLKFYHLRLSTEVSGLLFFSFPQPSTNSTPLAAVRVGREKENVGF